MGVTIIGSNFTKNIARDSGGALFLKSINATLKGNLFLENEALDGGAIYYDNLCKK